jgi:nucleotide-binding universal stress UspA family protein
MKILFAYDGSTWVRNMVESASDVLRRAGLHASGIVKQGSPKKVLVDEADLLDVDCIFIGARGLGAVGRFMLGSVSMAVTARAHCSVEVVRLESDS